MVRPSMRGGVPVFSRPMRGASSRRRVASRSDGGSPARPPEKFSSPTWMRPPRNVPAVSTTARAAKRMPVAVTTAAMRSPSSYHIRHFLLEHIEACAAIPPRGGWLRL